MHTQNHTEDFDPRSPGNPLIEHAILFVVIATRFKALG